MNFKVTALVLGFAGLCGLGTVGCNSGPDATPPATNSTQTGGAKGGTSSSGWGSGNVGVNGPGAQSSSQIHQAAQTQAVGQAAVSPGSWCAAAGNTQVVQQKLSDLYSQLCTGGQATQLFANTLVGTAYSGNGNPTLQPIQPAGDNGGQVSAVYGAAIKMPVNIEQHFSAIAPRMGNQSVISNMVQAEGTTPNNISINPEGSNSDQGWVRGWQINISSESRTGPFNSIKIDTSYAYQEDQYQLGNGLYMYTSTITNPGPTIQDYEILIAGLDLNGVGYQVVVAKVVANDQGHADQATSGINGIASNLVKYMYQQSAGN